MLAHTKRAFDPLWLNAESSSLLHHGNKKYFLPGWKSPDMFTNSRHHRKQRASISSLWRCCVPENILARSSRFRPEVNVWYIIGYINIVTSYDFLRDPLTEERYLRNCNKSFIVESTSFPAFFQFLMLDFKDIFLNLFQLRVFIHPMAPFISQFWQKQFYCVVQKD